MLIGSDRLVPRQPQVPVTTLPLQQWTAMSVASLPQPKYWEIPVSTMSIPQPSISVPEEKPTNESQTETQINIEDDGDFSEEVLLINRLFKDKPESIIPLLSGQLALLKTEAQVILGLCGLALTVTGFSGGNVIRSGSLAANFLVAGIAFIMVAGTLALYSLSNVKWITQLLHKDIRRTIQDVVIRRDIYKRILVVSCCFLGLGLTMYLLAVSIAAVKQGDQLKE